MRNPLIYCATLLLCSFLFSATARAQIQKIYLNPKAAGNEKQSRIVDSLRFIPLAVKGKFDFDAYDGVTVAGKYFMIVDYSGSVLSLFSRNGDFIKKINYRKLGEDADPDYREERNQIVFFGHNKHYELTPKDHLQIRLGWNKRRNKKYFKKYTIDLDDPTFAIRKAEPTEWDILFAGHFYDDYYLEGEINTSPLFKDSLDYECNIYKGDQLVKSYFPYNRINEPRYEHSQVDLAFHTTDTPSIRMVTRPYCDTVYKLVKDSLFPVYQVVLPLENSLPASYFTKTFRSSAERQTYSQSNGSLFRQVYYFYETPRFILLSIGFFNKYETYVYQKQTGVTYKMQNIKPDSSQYDLNLIGSYGYRREGDTFYKLVKAGDLIAFFKKHQDVPVPEDLQAFLKKGPDEDVPVIVTYKIKS